MLQQRQSKLPGQCNSNREFTFAGFSRDPTSNWCSALRVVDQAIIRIKGRFAKHGQVLHYFYGYSDGCGKECANSAFIYALRYLCKVHELKAIYWTLTAPQHGKGKYDAEGHVIKTLLKLGAFDTANCKDALHCRDHLHYKTTEAFEVTMMEFLRKKFARPLPKGKQRQDRMLVNMSFFPHRHYNSADYVATWTGFKRFSAFRIEGNVS